MNDPNTYFTPLRMSRPFSPGAGGGGGGGSPVTPTLLHSQVGAADASNNIVTSSVSPVSNKVVYIGVVHAFGATPGDNVLAASGCGLTWERVGEVVELGAGNRRKLGVFRALGTATPGAITITGCDSFQEYMVAVVQWNNASTAGTNGSDATGTPVENAGSGNLSLTIPGTPGANDATFSFFMCEDGVTLTPDADWASLYFNDAGTDMGFTVDWDAGKEQNPTCGISAGGSAGIGFIVKAA